MKKTFHLFLIFFVLAFAACDFGKKNNENPEILSEELSQHVNYLASDSLAGRKPGTEGDLAAAKYIANEFEKVGLLKFNETYFQKLLVTTEVKAGEKNSFTIGEYSATLATDYTPMSYTANANVEAKVVFAGYGFNINEDSLKWNDFDKIDAKGKWVIILRADPELDNPNSAFITYSKDRTKILAARDAGAAGVLLVSGAEVEKDDLLMELKLGRDNVSEMIPVANITRALANKILLQSGKTIEDLEKLIIESHSPSSFEIETSVNISLEVIKGEVETQNVVAYIEGSDPNLKNEYVVLGAHYDHLGMGGAESGSRRPDTTAVHNGADDNASGVAAMIEIAEKLSAMKDSLKRSVVFVAFAGEEMGLLGSKFFAENPLFDLKSVQTMINLDMVGRLDTTSNTLSIGGTGTSTAFENLLKEMEKSSNLNIAQSPEGFGPSDHASFYVLDIPVLFFTTGGNSEYHTPFDDADLINFNGMKKVADFGFQLIVNLANKAEKIDFQLAGPKERNNSGRGLKVKLGIMPAYADENNQGVKVEAVTQGGPAFEAKMLKGDVIVAVNELPVQNIYDYMARLQTLKLGQTITVDVMREGKKVTLIVQL